MTDDRRLMADISVFRLSRQNFLFSRALALSPALQIFIADKAVVKTTI